MQLILFFQFHIQFHRKKNEACGNWETFFSPERSWGVQYVDCCFSYHNKKELTFLNTDICPTMFGWLIYVCAKIFQLHF